MEAAFDAYFRAADLDRDGRISGQEAVAFFKGLPQPVLAQPGMAILLGPIYRKALKLHLAMPSSWPPQPPPATPRIRRRHKKARPLPLKAFHFWQPPPGRDWRELPLDAISYGPPCATTRGSARPSGGIVLQCQIFAIGFCLQIFFQEVLRRFVSVFG